MFRLSAGSPNPARLDRVAARKTSSNRSSSSVRHACWLRYHRRWHLAGTACSSSPDGPSGAVAQCPGGRSWHAVQPDARPFCLDHRSARTTPSQAGTIVEVNGEGGMAPSSHLPAQHRVGRSQRIAVKLGAGVVEARDAAPDVTWPGGVAFGLDRQIADDVDALAGGGVLKSYPGRPDDVDLTDRCAIQLCDRSAGPAEEDVGDRGPLVVAGASVDVEHDLPGGTRLHAVEVAA